MLRWPGILFGVLALIALMALGPRVAAAHGGGMHAFHVGHFSRFGGFGRFGRFSRFARFGRFGIRGAAVAGYPGFYASPGYAPGCVWVRQLVPGAYGPVWRYYPACYYGY